MMPRLEWEFSRLPARPMIRMRIPVNGLTPGGLREYIRREVARLPKDSVVRIQLDGILKEDLLPVIRADSLRALCPPEMNVSLRFPRNTGIR